MSIDRSENGYKGLMVNSSIQPYVAFSTTASPSSVDESVQALDNEYELGQNEKNSKFKNLSSNSEDKRSLNSDKKSSQGSNDKKSTNSSGRKSSQSSEEKKTGSHEKSTDKSSLTYDRKVIYVYMIYRTII
jgi:hypothetical protein